MRKRLVGKLLVLTVATAALALGGCVMAPVVPPLGAVYSNVNAPLDLDCGSGKQIGPAKGEASTTTFFYLFAFGDAGIDAAARKGKLKTVNHVDYRFKNVLLGLYSRYTTVVYGETE
ncbi:TRL-like family protein [Candidatus Sumerlaeota bacterium]|nr:TRL-like family protein [Candidatus Sumerlaeota bacterium]